MSRKRQIIADQLARLYSEHQGKVMIVNHWEPAKPITDEKIDSVQVAMHGLTGIEETAEHTEEEFKRMLDWGRDRKR